MTMTTVAVVKDYVCGCVDGNFFFFVGIEFVRRSGARAYHRPGDRLGVDQEIHRNKQTRARTLHIFSPGQLLLRRFTLGWAHATFDVGKIRVGDTTRVLDD